MYYITPEKKLRNGFFINMKTFSRDKIFTMRDKTSEVNCSKYPRHFRKVEQKYFILLIIMIRHTQSVLHHSPQEVVFPRYFPLVSSRIHHCNIWEPLQIRMTDSIALDHLLRQIFVVILFFNHRKICNNQGLNFKKIAKINCNSTGSRESQFYGMSRSDYSFSTVIWILLIGQVKNSID